MTAVARVADVSTRVPPPAQSTQTPTPPAPELRLDPGYYPIPGWPLGTVRAWDGRTWQDPVTVPGFYDTGVDVVWWNGQSWIPEISPPQLVAAVPPRGRRRPMARAHRRRRPRPWHAAATTMMATAAALTASAVVVGLR